MNDQWVKKVIPVEPQAGITVTFSYDQPYTDKFGNRKWLCVDGQYVQCSDTLLKMLEHLGIKANMAVTIGKRQSPDGKQHFTVNGQVANEMFQGVQGAPQQAPPHSPPVQQTLVQQPPAPQAPQQAPGAIVTPQVPTNNDAGVQELKVHLESALKLVASLSKEDDLPF